MKILRKSFFALIAVLMAGGFLLGSQPPEALFAAEKAEDVQIHINKNADLYNEPGGEETAGMISPQFVKVKASDGDWLQIDTWEGLKWVNPKWNPKSVRLDVPVLNQRENGYGSGCEIVSTAMMINYTTPAALDTLVEKMPLSTDPELGFVGDVHSTPDGFTIFPPALMALTTEYMGAGLDMSGCEMEDLKTQLSKGAPIVIWVNGLGFNVHAICLTGYDENGFYYNDPWTGGKDAYIGYEDFYAIWNKPIEDENSGTVYDARKALSYIVD